MLTTVDGKPLKEALAHAQSRAKRRAFLLVLPLLAFIIVSFIFPIGQMLYRVGEQHRLHNFQRLRHRRQYANHD